MANYDNIPERLKNIPQWINHKKNKPIHSQTGQEISDITKLASWSTFEQAKAASWQADGIAFCLTPHDDFIAIHIDKVDYDIINNFDSYTEKTGCGCVIIAEAETFENNSIKGFGYKAIDSFIPLSGDILKNSVIKKSDTIMREWCLRVGLEYKSISDRATQIVSDANTARFENHLTPWHDDDQLPPPNIWKETATKELSPEQYAPANMGALSDIIQYYCDTAPVLRPQFAMHTAISIIATYLGRKFKTSSGNYTGLFMGVIGASGGGKGHCDSVVQRVLEEFDAGELVLGSGYTSDSAIFSALQKAPSHITIIDEIGDYIGNSRGARDAVTKSQWRVLKECWGKGGALRPRNYSDHTRKESNAQKPCFAPVINILGLSTREQFWGSLDTADSVDGFLNRWLIYTDMGQPEHPAEIIDMHEHPLPGTLRHWFDAIDERSPKAMKVGDDEVPHTPNTGKPEAIIVEWSDDCKKLWHDYKLFLMQEYWDRPVWPMYQRACQMAMMLSLIVELSRDPWATKISISSAKWSLDYVTTVIGQMSKYCKRNLAGSEEERIAQEILNRMREAGDRGLTWSEILKMKLTGGKASVLKDALGRLSSGKMAVKKINYKNPHKTGPATDTWFAIEDE
jgi:hypothetical protein